MRSSRGSNKKLSLPREFFGSVIQSKVCFHPFASVVEHFAVDLKHLRRGSHIHRRQAESVGTVFSTKREHHQLFIRKCHNFICRSHIFFISRRVSILETSNSALMPAGTPSTISLTSSLLHTRP
jgi:hypothetical protein